MARPSSPTANYPSSLMTLVTYTDIGENASVVDESISIPADPANDSMELDYVPAYDLEIWTGTGKTGTQYTIIRAGTPQSGQVLLGYFGKMTFAAADAEGTVYATYTGVASVATTSEMNRLALELYATQQQVSQATANSPGECIWGSGSVEAFSFGYIIGHDGDGTPILGLSQSHNVDTIPPFVFLTDAATQGSSISLPKCVGLVAGLTGLPTTGPLTLYLGTDGKLAWEGSANMPAPGDYIVRVGHAINSTKFWLDIGHEINRRP